MTNDPARIFLTYTQKPEYLSEERFLLLFARGEQVSAGPCKPCGQIQVPDEVRCEEDDEADIE